MEASTERGNALAYEDRGTGFPVVFLHGLTFGRATWRPIVDRLVDGYRCVAVDLPGHGETPGPPRPMQETADELHRLLIDLRIDRPVVVGHSAGAMLATIYGALYPAAGVVNVDQPLDVEPFARMVRQLEPALRGPSFAATFEPIRQSIGVELLPEPLRSRTLATQTVQQDLVVRSWDEVLQRSPEDLQALIDATAQQITVPYLAVFGHRLSDEERTRLRVRLRALELEEWPDRGHMLHLMEPDRFADRVARFIDSLT